MIKIGQILVVKYDSEQRRQRKTFSEVGTKQKQNKNICTDGHGND
jgi:hypothetical protein